MRLLKWLSLGAAVWMLYWAVAAWGLRSGLESWFAGQHRLGWQVSYGALTTGGFPLRHVTGIAQPLLADTRTGAAWSADWIAFDSPALWPGTQTLRFPTTEQRFSVFDRTHTLAAQDMQADMQLAPGLALELEQLSLTSQAWQISQDAEVFWQAQDLTVEMRQQELPTQYHLRAEAQGFAPGGVFRRLSQLSNQPPQRFDVLRARASVTFDRPWDRRSVEQRRPQPRTIDLELAEATWGGMRFKAAGQLQVDAQGGLTGEVALQSENWREILALAEQGSLLPPSSRAVVERLLSLFSGGSGGGEKLNTTLRLQQGQMWIGPLPVGTAPKLLLR